MIEPALSSESMASVRLSTARIRAAVDLLDGDANASAAMVPIAFGSTAGWVAFRSILKLLEFHDEAIFVRE